MHSKKIKGYPADTIAKATELGCTESIRLRERYAKGGFTSFLPRKKQGK